MKTFSRIFIAITIALIIFVIYITRDGDTFSPTGDGEVILDSGTYEAFPLPDYASSRRFCFRRAFRSCRARFWYRASSCTCMSRITSALMPVANSTAVVIRMGPTKSKTDPELQKYMPFQAKYVPVKIRAVTLHSGMNSPTQKMPRMVASRWSDSGRSTE